VSAAVAVEPLTVTEPGIYDIPAADYHRDPVPGGSMSSTGARRILPPGSPEKFAWEAEHGRPERRVFDLGHAAHREVLGDGEIVVVVEAEDYKTKAARDARDAAYAAGKAPILRREYTDTVLPMAAAIRAHPIAGRLFAPGRGRAELSLFWWDGTGPGRVMRRSRPDWLPDPAPGRRLIVPEYKTCASAAPDDLAAAIGRYGYYQQAAWNLDAVETLLDTDQQPAFVFVFQEKDPPYAVSVVQLAHTALQLGRERNSRALALYRRCRREDRWPGYSDDKVIDLALPGWLENRLSLEVDDDD
jgi:hypothetical protein